MAHFFRKGARRSTTVVPSPSIASEIQLTTRQRACLEQLVRRQTRPQCLVRRAKMLLALETGANQGHVTRQRHLNRGTVRVWRKRWGTFAATLEQVAADEGSAKALPTGIVEALTDHPRAGTPASCTAAQLVQIVAIAWEDPADSGRPVSHWTPREVADEVRTRGMVETISTRSVGRFLKSGRSPGAAGGRRAQRSAG